MFEFDDHYQEYDLLDSERLLIVSNEDQTPEEAWHYLGKGVWKLIDRLNVRFTGFATRSCARLDKRGD